MSDKRFGRVAQLGVLGAIGIGAAIFVLSQRNSTGAAALEPRAKTAAQDTAVASPLEMLAAPEAVSDSIREVAASERPEPLGAMTVIAGRVEHDCTSFPAESMRVMAWPSGAAVYGLADIQDGAAVELPAGLAVAVPSADGSYSLGIEARWGQVQVVAIGGGLYSKPVSVMLGPERVELDLESLAVYACVYEIVDAGNGASPKGGTDALVFGSNAYFGKGASVEHLRRRSASPLVEAWCLRLEEQLPPGAVVRYMLGSCGAPPVLDYKVHLAGYEPASGILPMYRIDEALQRIEKVRVAPRFRDWGQVQVSLADVPVDPLGESQAGDNIVLYFTREGDKHPSMHVLRLSQAPTVIDLPAGDYQIRVESIHDVGRRAVPTSAETIRIDASTPAALQVDFETFGHIRVLGDRDIENGEPFLVKLEDESGGYTTHQLAGGSAMLYGITPGAYTLTLLVASGFALEDDGQRSVPVEVVEGRTEIAVLPF